MRQNPALCRPTWPEEVTADGWFRCCTVGDGQRERARGGREGCPTEIPARERVKSTRVSVTRRPAGKNENFSLCLPRLGTLITKEFHSFLYIRLVSNVSFHGVLAISRAPLRRPDGQGAKSPHPFAVSCPPAGR